MAGHEHDCQLIVDRRMHGIRGPGAHVPGERALERGLVGVDEAVAADGVDRAVAGDLQQPRGGILRDTAVGPGLERRDQRVLHDFLRQVEVHRAEDRCQPRHEPCRLVAEQVVDEPGHPVRRHQGRSRASI